MKKPSKLNYVVFDEEKIFIRPFGDNHLGSSHCDKELLQEHINEVLETDNMFCIFMGDNIECATRDSVGAGVYEQEQIIDEQIDTWLSMVSPLAEKNKILGVHRGNHEDRIYKSSGLDITKKMAQQLGVKYFDHTIHHYFRVGNRGYTMLTTHGHSGARLPHTKIKAAIDYANMSDVDIYVVGHLHQLSHHTRTFYKIDRTTRTVVEWEKHFMVCGSYLDHWGSYAENAGYEMMRKGSPTIELSGLEHKIKVSL